MRIRTVGHGTRSIDEFIAVLGEPGIATLADVRTYPGSRRHPQFGQAALRGSLEAHDIAYVHLPGLGGRRDPRPDSPHTALRVAAFRGYADHMSTPEFATDLARLEALARERPTAYLAPGTRGARQYPGRAGGGAARRGAELHLAAGCLGRSSVAFHGESSA